MPIVEAVSQQIMNAEAEAESNQMTYINEAASAGLDIDGIMYWYDHSRSSHLGNYL